MDKKTDNMTNTLGDSSKIIDKAQKAGVKTPTQFAKVFEKNPPRSLTLAEVKTQVNALNDFEEGKISYSQMRSMCG